LVYAAYGQGDTKDPLANESKTKSVSLGVKHNLSVRTSLYAGWNQYKAGSFTASTGDIRDDHFGLGMNVKF